ncbi:hypothetical protein ACFQPF_08370 [Fictibacillus iocasae]|uniref:DUF2268 domain-containing protein n=1 Tax=Fictibacillus iocasae TaxID=2715437 RepID=A0ABW2NMJ7_9BACL
MDFFIQTVKAIVVLLLAILLIFLSFLLLDGKQGLFAAALLLTAMFGLLIFFIQVFIIDSSIRKDPLRLLSCICCLLISGAVVTAVAVTNESLYTVLPHSNLKPVDKIYFYKEALLYRSERKQTRLKYLQSLKSYRRDGFTLYYSEKDESLAKKMVHHSPKVKKIMNALTGGFLLKPVNVILYSNPFIFQDHVPKHRFDRLKGMYVPSENTIHLFIGDHDRTNEEALLKRFAHEYGHHFIVSFLESHGLNNRHLPRWFEEGTAEYAAEKSIRLRTPFRPLNIIPFKRLHTKQQWEEANRKSSPHHPYKQSFHAVDELIRIAGPSEVGKLMLLSSDGNFYGWLEKISAMSLEEFQVSFLAEEMEIYKDLRRN